MMNFPKLTFPAAAIAVGSVLLAACSSGAGSGAAGLIPSATAGLQTSARKTPDPGKRHGSPVRPGRERLLAATTATGHVVDDQTGKPLAGVTVKLMPWGPCGPTPAPTKITPEADGCPTPLPQPQATTDATGQFTLADAPNGKYVLVVGTDAVVTPPPSYTPSTCYNACPTPSPVPFTTTATVHDVVTLTGGTQELAAPNIAAILTAEGGNVITPPAWETNGDYRVATLDPQVEMPCLVAWQYRRSQHGLAMDAVDEWAIEAARDSDAYQMIHNSGLIASLSSGWGVVSGGVSCDTSLITQVVFNSGNKYPIDPRTLWFGGNYYYDGYNGWDVAGAGYMLNPIDPRSFTDPNHVWP